MTDSTRTHSPSPLHLLQADLARVEEELKKRVASETSIFPEIANYALFAGGKRVRPAMFLLSLRMCGAGDLLKREDSFAIAAVFELIHAASILHDDVIDEAELRRGRTAVNVYWGNKKTILLGDYLFLKGIQSVVDAGHTEVLPVIIDTITTMIEGEGREVDLKYRLDVTEADCLEISRLKTAILFANSTRLGSVLAGADEAQTEALAAFGMNLGLAFQLVDDILDYTSDAATLGKPVFNDFDEGKPTVPLVEALRHASPEERAYIERYFTDKHANHAEAHARVLKILETYDAFAYTARLGERLMDEARTGLAVFPDTLERQTLLDIADFTLARKS